jgi:hypothetical protein
MNNYYLDNTNALGRLIYEYRKYGNLVIAYDYDDTVFDFHKRGDNFEKVIKLIRRCKYVGFDLVVFTYSDGSRFDEIRKYLTENNIPFDRINTNPDFTNKDSKKIFYNYLLDDRAGLKSAYDNLTALINIIELEKDKEIIENIKSFPPDEESINWVKRTYDGMMMDINNELNPNKNE